MKRPQIFEVFFCNLIIFIKKTMKVSQILSLGIFSILLFSCATAQDKLKTGTIVRDCTGTYIRVGENEDFLVCNSKILESRKTGEKVSVVFDSTEKCIENTDKVTCMMYHESKGVIQIKSIQ